MKLLQIQLLYRNSCLEPSYYTLNLKLNLKHEVTSGRFWKIINVKNSDRLLETRNRQGQRKNTHSQADGPNTQRVVRPCMVPSDAPPATTFSLDAGAG